MPHRSDLERAARAAPPPRALVQRLPHLASGSRSDAGTMPGVPVLRCSESEHRSPPGETRPFPGFEAAGGWTPATSETPVPVFGFQMSGSRTPGEWSRHSCAARALARLPGGWLAVARRWAVRQPGCATCPVCARDEHLRDSAVGPPLPGGEGLLACECPRVAAVAGAARLTRVRVPTSGAAPDGPSCGRSAVAPKSASTAPPAARPARGLP